MNDQDNSAANKPESDQEPPAGSQIPNYENAVPSVNSLTSNGSVKEIEAKDASVETNQRSEDVKPLNNILIERPRSSDRWMTILTAIIALSTLANVVVYWRESESAAKQTQNLIDAANIQAGAASKNADAAASFANTADKINLGISNAVAQLSASAKSSESLVKVSQDAMRLSQRPWVGVDDDPPGLSVSAIEFDEQGNAWGDAFIRPKNFSAYAAQEVMSNAELIISDTGADIFDPQKTCMKTGAGYGNVLFPGRTGVQQSQTGFDIPLHYPRDKMTHPNVAKKTTTLSIIGCISYADQFDLPYHTGFVFRLYDPATHRPVVLDPIPKTTINGQWSAFTGSITAAKEKPRGHQKK